jgi:carbohydrate diacid regulator
MATGDVLTPELAQEIACDIGRVTGFNVPITDREAVVIHRGDTGRSGTVHEAPYEVLRTRRPGGGHGPSHR